MSDKEKEQTLVKKLSNHIDNDYSDKFFNTVSNVYNVIKLGQDLDYFTNKVIPNVLSKYLDSYEISKEVQSMILDELEHAIGHIKIDHASYNNETS